MRTTGSDPQLSEEALGQLQSAILTAILTSAPLAGHTRPLILPDLPRMLHQSAILLSSENLGGPIHVEGTTKPIHILSEEALVERSKQEGNLLYLRFQPPQRTPDGVLLTLKIQTGQHERNMPRMGMSGIQVTFQQHGDEWRAAEDTAAFAE